MASVAGNELVAFYRFLGEQIDCGAKEMSLVAEAVIERVVDRLRVAR